MGNCQNQSILQYAHSPQLGKLGPVTELRVVNYVWLRDYQGLFDYDSKDVRKTTLNIKDNCMVFADGEKRMIRQLTSAEKTEQTMKQAIFQVVKCNNFFKILPINIENEQYTIQKLLWLAVRTLPSQKYPIREKDVLKLGKLKVRVREIVTLDSNPSTMMTYNSIRTNKKIYEDIRMHDSDLDNVLGLPNNQMISIATENDPICRICLEPGETNNPLICPCKCTGSVKYIHLLCLRTWLGKQLNIGKHKHGIVIKWTPLSCQMCKSHYKYRIYLDNKKYYTVQIPKPAKPYIVLEVLKKSSEYSKIYHFISMSQTSKLTIGRKKDIDIKLSEDISVSRHHANLIYDFEGRRFVIEDNKSKFGTLVLMKKNMLANPIQRGISFQIAGELYTFECIRGQGSIPDYRDQTQYLNVPDINSSKIQEEEESEDDEQMDGEEDEPVSPLPHHLQMHHANSLTNPNLSNRGSSISFPLNIQHGSPVISPALSPEIQPLQGMQLVLRPVEELGNSQAYEEHQEQHNNVVVPSQIHIFPPPEVPPGEVENLDQ